MTVYNVRVQSVPRIDRAPVSSFEAARIVARVPVSEPEGIKIYRRGSWALIDGSPPEKRPLERLSAGWREIR